MIETNRDLISTLIVETCSKCNLKCVMCPTLNYEDNKIIMTDEIFGIILEIISKHDIKRVELTGWGEPLMDNKLFERIKMIKRISQDIKVGFITNATLLNNKNVLQLFESKTDYINVSFDAASQETYDHIRGKGNYVKIMRNLKWLTEYRGKISSPIYLSSTFVVIKENYHEMEDYVNIFAELGFNEVTFKPNDVIASSNDLNYCLNKRMLKNKYTNIVNRWKGKIKINQCNIIESNITNNCLATAATGSVFIAADGTISPCCNLAHKVDRYEKGLIWNYKEYKDKYFFVDNICVMNISEIYNSKKYSEFRHKIRNGIRPYECEGCLLISSKFKKDSC